MDWSIVLTALAGLFGTLNIFQFIFFRVTKKKYEAEAEQAKAEAKKATVEAEHGKVDLQQDQYDYVNEQLSRIQKEYHDLAARYRATMSEHLKEIDEKCHEIADLRSKVTYFKGLRCYCTDCERRVKESPYKKKENYDENTN